MERVAALAHEPEDSRHSILSAARDLQHGAGSQAEAHQPRNVSEEAVLESVDVVERNVEEDRRSQPAGAISCALCAPSSLPTDDGNDCRSRHCRSAVARLDVRAACAESARCRTCARFRRASGKACR